MSNYCYEAVDSGGLKIRGTLEVADQGEALKRIKEMGLFPTKIAQAARIRRRARMTTGCAKPALSIPILGGRVRTGVLTAFTRQLATLIEAGMPLLRGLRVLQEQAESAVLKRLVGELASHIEDGGSLSDGLAIHPRAFNPLYINMVKAGEASGCLEVALRRLAEFMEKTQKIKRKVKSALFYPVAVLTVAAIILGVLLVYIVPRFQEVFQDLLNGAPMPPFTLLVLKISGVVKSHVFAFGLAAAVGGAAIEYFVRTGRGRQAFDRFKLGVPLLGSVFRKMAISRFTRTFGTLLSSGVPVLQALTIVKQTAGNVIVGNVISTVHDSVKEGESIAGPLKASPVFPAMVAGMVGIGEQTGALPDMLMRIADNYDDEVDNAVTAMTSLLEPILIVFLAVVVGSIVIALFLPILYAIGGGYNGDAAAGGDI